jgi:hypothetical protein
MLNSILVLGQIPGTNLQLSFTDILCVVLLMLCACLAHLHRKEIRAVYFRLKLTRLLVRENILQQLHQKRLFKLPGRLTGHTG